MNFDFSTQADDWVVISQSLIDSIFRVISSPGYIWIPFIFSLAIWIFTQRTRKSEQNSPTLALISSTGEWPSKVADFRSVCIYLNIDIKKIKSSCGNLSDDENNFEDI